MADSETTKPTLDENEGNQDQDEEEGATEGLEEEDQEAEEFRAKYGLDLNEEEEGDETREEEDEEAEGDVVSPTEEQMTAIIQYLEGDEEEESSKEKGETVEEDGPPSSALTTPSKYGASPEPNVLVLGPDHPKMARFQLALRQHLEKQIFLADAELRDLNGELKTRKKERTDLGTSLYNLQHEILRQSETMEKHENELVRMGEKREKMESKNSDLRNFLDELKSLVRQEEEKDGYLRESVRTLDYTEHMVRQAAEKFQGELKIRQLVQEKLAKLRVKAEEEKKDQDFYLDKIINHVQRMEEANAGLRRQIQAHEEEHGQLNTYITEAATELEALQIEKTHLQKAWNDTISVVRARDEAIQAARQTLVRVKEDVKLRDSELRTLTSRIEKEQETHERSVILVKRRKMEERVLKRQLCKLQDENERLKDHLNQLNKIRKSVEVELLRGTNLLSRKEKDALVPRRQLEALNLERLRLEDQLLSSIQEQSGLDKAVSNIQLLIKKTREKTRLMEIDLSKVENDNSHLAVEVEKLRADLFKKQSLVNELEKRCLAQEQRLKEIDKDVVQSERILQRKTADIEKMNRKLSKAIEKSGGLEVSPLELELKTMEKELVEEKNQISILQEEWLKRQDELVRLSNERDHIHHQNELVRKEIFVMERKRQRLDSEIERRRMDISRIRKQIESCHSEVATVNSKLYQNKATHDQLDRDNILMQNELVALLKDAEMEALSLQREIEILEEEKANVIYQLQEAHEQNLLWEKKVKIAKELKENIKKEQEGSNSAVKLEIHHMQVRYNEILRAQEKLMGDLERCIERRDRIIHRADLSLRKDQKNIRHTKLNIQRNLASVKERNRQLVREANEIEAQVEEMLETMKGLEDKWSNAANELNKVKESIAETQEKIMEASVQKHKNLVEIILRQEKFRILESIKYDRYKPPARAVQDLQKLIEETEQDCLSILEIADKVEQQYPETTMHVKLVKASILPSVT